MLSDRKWMFVMVGIILVAGLILVNYFQSVDPQQRVQRTLGIKLTTGSQIERFRYSKQSDAYKAKIRLSTMDLDNIKKDIVELLGSPKELSVLKDIPNFKNTAPWWDLDVENVEVCYMRTMSGEKRLFRATLKTREVWALISKGNDNQYYLYISY